MKIKSILFAVLFSISLIFSFSFSSQTGIVTNVSAEKIECDHYWTIEVIDGVTYIVERDCNDRIISMIPLED